jgi:hypothetical protein
MTTTETEAAAPVARIPLEGLVLWLSLLSGLCSAFAFWWQRHSLWEDEIIAMTHGLQPLPGFFVEILRNDIHPFFYFLLLKFWIMPFPASDPWILASSLATAMLSVVAIAWVANRCYGSRAALWAAAIYCVLPNFAWAAGNLRMYSLIPAMAVLVWYGQRRMLQGESSRAAIGLTLVAELLLGYTHAIELFFLAFIALAARWEQNDVAGAREKRHWLVSQIACGFCLLPLVLPALLRGTEPLAPSTLATLVRMPPRLFTGWALENDLHALLAGGVIFWTLLIAALAHRGGRVLALVATCGVLAFAWALGSLGKPMFKTPVFTANTVPFLVLAAAAGFASMRARIPRAAALAGVLVLAFATWPWSGRMVANGNFRAAGELVAGKVKPGDLVVVPGLSTFWGVVRYAAEPNWGRPLEVMPIKDNPQWAGLKARFGPVAVAFLGLDARTDFIEYKGVRYVVGADARAHPLKPDAALFVVHRRRYPEPVSLGFEASPRAVTWIADDISVTELRRMDGGTRIVENPPAGSSR